jgi:tight adherence protein B
MLGALFVGIFLAFAATFTIGALVWAKRDRKQRALTALQGDSAREAQKPATLLRAGSQQQWQSRFSLEPLRLAVEKQIQQADLSWSASKFLLITFVLAAAGFGAGIVLRPDTAFISAPLFGALAGSAPYLHVRRARTKRSRKIEEQFPDALDFLSRAMRAGHAFSVSLEMLAEETPEPMGGEFRKLYQQQNLGSPIETALQSFADRCGLLDVQFFVSAVILQKETGGNLTEILTRLSYTIRERLRLKGQVRAASAHGRVTGMVLTGMPVVLMLGMMVVSPGYLPGMLEDTHGRYMLTGAVAGQFIGYLCIKSITDIRV